MGRFQSNANPSRSTRFSESLDGRDLSFPGKLLAVLVCPQTSVEAMPTPTEECWEDLGLETVRATEQKMAQKKKGWSAVFSTRIWTT